MTAIRSTLEVEGEDRQDLVAVDRLAFGIDREHAIAVTVESDAEVEPSVADDSRQKRQVGRAAADVDVLAVRRRRDRCDLGAEPLERLRRDARVRPVCAVDRDPEP